MADSKALIPLNGRLSLEDSDCPLNEDGIPCCPKKPELPMKRVCHCENPCTSSPCGRMVYIYPEQNLRAYPGTARGTSEWDSTYKIRMNVEKSINHFQDSFCIANRKTQNAKTLHGDLLLAEISQLITVIVADKTPQHQYVRSLKPFAKLDQLFSSFRNCLYIVPLFLYYIKVCCAASGRKCFEICVNNRYLYFLKYFFNKYIDILAPAYFILYTKCKCYKNCQKDFCVGLCSTVTKSAPADKYSNTEKYENGDNSNGLNYPTDLFNVLEGGLL